jgi:hypothetical protein
VRRDFSGNSRRNLGRLGKLCLLRRRDNTLLYYVPIKTTRFANIWHYRRNHAVVTPTRGHTPLHTLVLPQLSLSDIEARAPSGPTRHGSSPQLRPPPRANHPDGIHLLRRSHGHVSRKAGARGGPSPSGPTETGKGPGPGQPVVGSSSSGGPAHSLSPLAHR